VEDKVVVEIKSVEAVAPVHKKQLLTYLRLMDRRLGLLINFNVALIKPLRLGVPDCRPGSTRKDAKQHPVFFVTLCLRGEILCAFAPWRA
jgi:hypothetical protein